MQLIAVAYVAFEAVVIFGVIAIFAILALWVMVVSFFVSLWVTRRHRDDIDRRFEELVERTELEQLHRDLEEFEKYGLR